MNVATSECPWCPADRFWCSHADRVETKSRHHWHFFSTLEKKSNDVFTFAIDEMFCFVSFEIPWEPTAALYEFSIYSWFKEWYSAKTRYRFVSTPGTLAKFISRKTRVQLADLPKVRCERSVFSAPRQRMSVVEGREVIVNYIEKICPVISELSINFLLHRASRHHASGWPRRPGLSRVWVEPDPNFLRGTFCIVVQASWRNKPEPKRLMQ